MDTQHARFVGTAQRTGSVAIALGLEVNGRVCPLGTGTYLIGRAANVDFRLDGTLVSRQHAALDVQADGVVLRDLASRNGVTINGERIDTSANLEVGDVLGVGSYRLRLVRRDPKSRRTAATTRRSRVHVLEDVPLADEDELQLTNRGDALELLGSIVDRALEQGNTDEAESMVSGHLSVFLNEARVRAGIRPEACAAAADYALKLARSTGKSRWVDYVFQLHLVARRPMSLHVVHELDATLPLARVSHRDVVEEYLRMLRSLSSREAGPQCDYVVQRLERLMNAAAAVRQVRS